MQLIPTAGGGELVLLSPRERQVVRLVARGQSHKSIAATLAISESSVKTYAGKLIRRLGLEGRIDLALWAIAHPEALDGIAVDPTYTRPFGLAA